MIYMADYRCPKHDLVFQALTDLRPPGALANKEKNLPAHPQNGHPDCPLCMEEAKTASVPAPEVRAGKTVVSNV
jgi:hypothetical protein